MPRRDDFAEAERGVANDGKVGVIFKARMRDTLQSAQLEDLGRQHGHQGKEHDLDEVEEQHPEGEAFDARAFLLHEAAQEEQAARVDENTNRHRDGRNEERRKRTEHMHTLRAKADQGKCFAMRA